MYFECNECQVVLHGERPPVVCPNCGLAGVIYSQVDDVSMAAHLAEGDEAIELELEFLADDEPLPRPRVH